MNPLRRRLADWLFGFGQPVPDDYVPPVTAKPEPLAPLLILTPTPTVVEIPQAPTTERCAVCGNPTTGSLYYCGDECQRAWTGRQANPLPSNVQLRDGTLLNPTRRVG